MRVSLGAPFCRELEVPLKELERLIPLAKNAGLDVAWAQAIYDDLNGYLIYVPLIGDACEKHTEEARKTVNKLRLVLNANALLDSSAEPAPVPLRPDYTDPSYVVTGADVADPEKQVIPSWVKWSAIAVAGAFLLAQVTPLVQLAMPRRLAGYRRRRRRSR